MLEKTCVRSRVGRCRDSSVLMRGEERREGLHNAVANLAANVACLSKRAKRESGPSDDVGKSAQRDNGDATRQHCTTKPVGAGARSPVRFLFEIYRSNYVNARSASCINTVVLRCRPAHLLSPYSLTSLHILISNASSWPWICSWWRQRRGARWRPCSRRRDYRRPSRRVLPHHHHWRQAPRLRFQWPQPHRVHQSLRGLNPRRQHPPL